MTTSENENWHISIPPTNYINNWIKIYIKSIRTFNENHEFFALYLVRMKVDFQSQQESEGGLVHLVETANWVAEDLKSHTLNDVLYTFRWNRWLVWSSTQTSAISSVTSHLSRQSFWFRSQVEGLFPFLTRTWGRIPGPNSQILS